MDESPNLINEMKRSKLIAVVSLEDEKDAIPLANALINGGIKFMEITFRTESAIKAIQLLLNANLPIHVGTGTVRTLEQVKASYEAKVEFMVSPGFNPEIVKLARKKGIPFFPGVSSPIGIEQAISLGLNILKFFPASVMGGVKWLKAMKGPYFDLQFIPTGGINTDNLHEYLEVPNVLAVGGSFLAPKAFITEGKFEEITKICEKAMNIVKKNT
ncbi:MAG: bifunctional 4-hydroxy-2-oxoglutarate aldolase/2-dehydro-3-deoxy-phosphogluconate aldolase [Promethearchaeota archaeon]